MSIMLFEPFEFSGMKLKNRVVSVPVIKSGKIPMPDLAEEIRQEGKADLIGLGRPLLCDPDWVKKAMRGRGEEIVRCIYCNHCAEVNDLFQTTTCIQWPEGCVNAPSPFLPKQKRKVQEIEPLIT